MKASLELLYSSYKRFGGKFKRFSLLFLFCFDLLILLKLEKRFTYKFYSYNRTKNLGACLYSDSCVSKIFSASPSFSSFTMSWHLDVLTRYSKNLLSDKILSRTVGRLLNLPTTILSSAYHFWVTLSTDKSFMKGIMSRPNMSIASGSPWVVHS